MAADVDLLDVLKDPDNVGILVVAGLDATGGVHGEGGDGWLVRDGGWFVVADVDVLVLLVDPDNVGKLVVAVVDVTGGVHGEGGDGWLVREGE